MSKGWIGVDLDGTLAHYDKWRGETHVGEPVVPMVDRVRRWLAAGHEVRIFTARVSEPNERDRAKITECIQAWAERHIGARLAVTCVKDYAMSELFDDRAVQVEANTGRLVGYSRRGLE